MSASQAITKRQSRAGRPAIYPSIQQKILRHIEQNHNPGEVMESEKQFALHFGVSRTLIRRALVGLQEEGKVVSVPGKGHFVAEETEAGIHVGVISAILGSTTIGGPLRDPSIGVILEGMIHSVERSPFRLVWESIGPQHRQVAELMKPHLQDLAGVVLVPLSNQSPEDMIQSVPSKAKKVVLGRPATDEKTPCVYVNHANGIKQALQYLAAIGHRRIGYLRLTENAWPEKVRYDAYVSELEKLSIPFDPSLVAQSVIDGERVEHVVKHLIRQKKNEMTTLLVSGGAVLPHVLRALAYEKVSIPKDLSLVCYDDVPASREHFPSITVIRQPLYKTGVLAVEKLIEYLTGNLPKPRETVLSTELIVRESVIPVTGK